MNAKEFAHELEKAASFIRQQQAEIEALKEGIEKLKDAYCQKDHEVKEAKYGITTKWDGGTTYHETTEPIGKAQEK